MTTDAPRSERDDDHSASDSAPSDSTATAGTELPSDGTSSASSDGTPPAAETATADLSTPATAESTSTESLPGPSVPAAAESTGAGTSDRLVDAGPGPSMGSPAGAMGTHVSVSQDAVAEMPNEPPPTATAPPSETMNTANTHAGVAPPLAEHAATVQEPATGIPAPAPVIPDEMPEGTAPTETVQPKPSVQERMRPGNDEEAVPVPTQGPAAQSGGSRGPVEVPRDDETNLDPALEAQISEQLSGTMQTAAPGPEPTGDGDDSHVQTVAEATAALVAGDLVATGQKVEGTVTTIHGDGVFIDFGARLSGSVPTRQFPVDDLPKVGDKLEVIVQQIDETEGVILCSRPGSRASSKKANWDEVAEGQVVDARVTKRNKGGLEVTVGSLRGFMPASQVDSGFVENLDQFVGQTLQARVLEVNPAKRKLVVSRKSLMMESRRESEKELFAKLEKGDKVSGTVKSIKDFGAFIDLGGADGLLHIGQISWSRIGHPSEVLDVGQEIEVQVLDVDAEKKKISLSMRNLASNPWTQAEQKYPIGSTQSGKVTRVTDFGAFVMVEPGVEGLIHISQIDHRRVRRVEDELSVGQAVEAKVLEVDPGRKRISLSLKAMKAAPEQFDAAPIEDRRPKRPRRNDLRGGSGSAGGKGGLFGNPKDFS